MARRLFIGGPWDGQWHEATGTIMSVMKQEEVDVMQYLAPNYKAPCEVPIPERVEYYEDMVDLFGYKLAVMVAYRELDNGRAGRTEALLRVILQRDVAAYLNLGK